MLNLEQLKSNSFTPLAANFSASITRCSNGVLLCFPALMNIAQKLQGSDPQQFLGVRNSLASG
jgi:hypothetical protein